MIVVKGRSMALVMSAILLFAFGCTTSARKQAPDAAVRQKLRTSDCKELNQLIQRTRRGYVPIRSADILPIPAEPHYIGDAALPVHTGPWDYLAEVPLVLYGPDVLEAERSNEPVTLADLAPTTAELIGFEDFAAPDGDAFEVETRSVPRLVVTIVWDGAGWNTLREHEDSWPFLKRAMRKGVVFEEATIGSTPSNTPPIHTTIGTGAFPRTHGIPHVKIRLAEGGYVDPFEGDDASAVRVPTLGDVYDRSLGNAPKVGVVATVNWHLGMIGHGAGYKNGDRDTAVLLNDQGLSYGNSTLYDTTPHGDPTDLQAATDRLDGLDGERDGRWHEDELDDLAVRNATPAFTQYQQRVLEATIKEGAFGADEVADLLYVNFKQIDDAGHQWGMTSDQVAADVRAADKAFERLTRFLDATVGTGKWVVVITADHGQTLYPEQSGGWPIRGSELNADIREAFPDTKILRVTSAGIFLADPNNLDNGQAEEVAEWLIDYSVEDNVSADGALPNEWLDHGGTRLFSAVLVGRKVVSSACANG